MDNQTMTLNLNGNRDPTSLCGKHLNVYMIINSITVLGTISYNFISHNRYIFSVR